MKSTLPLGKETRENCFLFSYKQNKGKEKSVLMQSELIFNFFPQLLEMHQALLPSVGPFGTHYKLASGLDTTTL